MATATEPGLDSSHANDPGMPSIQQNRGLRFWGTFVCLCILAFISALDVAVITIALPTITNEIGGAHQYIWIANSFVVASSVLQPLIGQLADAFGRRTPLISSVVAFALGSGLAGSAYNAAMLIAGRTIQGVGAGGIYILLDIVCCDLVPLRERGKYLGLMFSWSGVAAALGPPVGGALAEANWRWIFYMNLPICGVALGGLLLFMQVRSGATNANELGIMAKLGRLDIIGNVIFTPSMISLLIGLIGGGTQHPWSSWRIILPLLLGIIGWISFHILQFFVEYPSVPPCLFSNRTSATAFLLTFTSSVLLQVLSYFLPIYFQAVKHTTVLRSGILFLPFALGALVFAVVAGTLLSKFGKYRPLHALAFALASVAFGLFTLLGPNTPEFAYVLFELIASAGMGMIMSVLLPAIMAPLPEKYVASSSATYSFVRTFGYIWGITIPGLIFNAVFNHHLPTISDPTVQSQLRGGAAYAFASQMHALQNTLSPAVWGEVIAIYVKSLKAIWWVCLGISLLSFFTVALEREVKLREELDTEYGLD
ncbi:MFS general substrate transporter [Cucurbitaria berberidis CBS 394.84]|uniref:MFS general substrate transporter n=1 Tax=Cucurbitaria berberidis CBS 394.84 TaxID=1168544 RepID=A0A9P4GT16_9PLEO|nr:MFS general substrate transporter [Cucurbitaria berberidis CBS 394.84]KAF1852228.1 MFS general substrate transporter [Cucurbitaria berberidis CBS 394.84]